MTSITSIALSGIHAAQVVLNSSAHNIANMATPGFHRQEVLQNARKDGGVETAVMTADAEGAAIEADVIAQLEAKNAFLANLAVFKASDQMAGALLDQEV